MKESKRVVITGLGALTPIGNNVKDFWTNLISGKSGAGPITKFDTEKFKTKFACELKDFDPADHFDRKEIRKMDPFCQYALVAADEAVSDAKIDFDSVNKNRIGVIWASANGGMETFENQVTEFNGGDGTPRFNPFFIPRILCDTSSGLISIKYGIRGINYNTISACASATTALVDAFNYVKWGKADMIIAGGSEAAITRSGIGGFGALRALSTLNDTPEIASRPFDTERDGFVMGEGAGAMILEDYDHALARGAKIYGEVLGGGMSGDAYHMTATHPDGIGAILGMEMALEDADLTPQKIDYINAHATSTPLGDVSELNALVTLFKDHAKNMNISATKSMTGHLLGAAGAVEAIATLLSIKENIIPPTINTQNLDGNVPDGLNLTLGVKQEREVNYALSNTFGFGGHNASIIFGDMAQ
ncbi:beta-ketoacyl-ACP synthase II [Fulvivirgaceae bacterium BMA10]|uniref:3-oxoacyl-[acyl-carrier-protein] synthase 2 n=1 Tax=Splendidivirga corallicola TaxID=3051826 RepID=A0ABT8KLR4_9BACT|nr:beta-ketoacyl-ACP synthase II [Fulvivirgaceae bacterium BMA10]